ncbi:MAG: late competence development ComFB family protein [Spirochaetaceae bacterium]|jgi:competence protein ComFB|nr:late competence development ComFB family protein [Spirochaetaceae bacterium]
MEIHNIIEETVIQTVKEVCDAITRQENPEKLCTCSQCRLDTACYVLNRTVPHYVVSNRGIARMEMENLGRQQEDADIAALVHEGIRRVNASARPYHGNGTGRQTGNSPVFNIPTIVGRLFNGLNFSPMDGAEISLYRNGKLVPMKDLNWQNPYRLVYNTEGTFTFWPDAVRADAAEQRETFEYSIKISTQGFEDLNHFFRIPVISEQEAADAFSKQRTFKLPDLYLFPPGEKDDLCIKAEEGAD